MNLTGDQQEEREEEQEGEAEEDLLEILEEADLIQADRVIDDEDSAKAQRRKEEEHRAVHELAGMLLAMKLENEEEETVQPQQKSAQWEVTVYISILWLCLSVYGIIWVS